MLIHPANGDMWEFRFYWDKWRLSYDFVVAVDGNDDETGFNIHVVYFGPFVIARHTIPHDHR